MTKKTQKKLKEYYDTNLRDQWCVEFEALHPNDFVMIEASKEYQAWTNKNRLIICCLKIKRRLLRLIIKFLCVFMVMIAVSSCTPKYWRADISQWQGRTPEELCKEISKKVKYVSDQEAHGEDFWQSPGYTEFEKEGDCDDYCIIMIDLLDQLGIESVMITFEKISGGRHAIVSINDDWFDPTYGFKIKIKENKTNKNYYTFKEIIQKLDN